TLSSLHGIDIMSRPGRLKRSIGPQPVGRARSKRPASSARLGLEAVALAVHRQEVHGALRVGLELLPEAQHVGVDRPGRREALVAPPLAEQAIAGDALAPMLDQVQEELELLPRHPDLLPRLEDLAAPEVQPDVAEGVSRQALARPGAPEDGPDAGQQ